MLWGVRRLSRGLGEAGDSGDMCVVLKCSRGKLVTECNGSRCLPHIVGSAHCPQGLFHPTESAYRFENCNQYMHTCVSVEIVVD